MIAVAFAIFMAALVSIPLLAALARGERARYLNQRREWIQSAYEIAWKTQGGRDYGLVTVGGRVHVVRLGAPAVQRRAHVMDPRLDAMTTEFPKPGATHEHGPINDLVSCPT